MKVTLQQTERLFLEEDLSFNSLGFSMLVTRLKVLYAKDPSEHTLKECNSALNAFFDRFRVGMDDDYEIITRL